MVFTIFGCLFVTKSNKKFLPTSMKSLTNYENPSSYPLQGAFSVFLIAVCVSKNCSESRRSWMYIEEKPEQKKQAETLMYTFLVNKAG
jgi:hypothetical protein